MGRGFPSRLAVLVCLAITGCIHGEATSRETRPSTGCVGSEQVPSSMAQRPRNDSALVRCLVEEVLLAGVGGRAADSAAATVLREMPVAVAVDEHLASLLRQLGQERASRRLPDEATARALRAVRARGVTAGEYAVLWLRETVRRPAASYVPGGAVASGDVVHSRGVLHPGDGHVSLVSPEVPTAPPMPGLTAGGLIQGLTLVDQEASGLPVTHCEVRWEGAPSSEEWSSTVVLLLLYSRPGTAQDAGELLFLRLDYVMEDGRAVLSGHSVLGQS